MREEGKQSLDMAAKLGALWCALPRSVNLREASTGEKRENRRKTREG